MLTPGEIIETAYGIGERKIAATRNSKLRLFTASLQGGGFVGLGGLLSVVVSSGFFLYGNNPSLAKLMAGMFFPVGLIMIVILGAELFTGNNALLIPAFMKKKYTVADVLTNWTVVYFGNFIGIVLFAWLFVYCCGITSGDPYHQTVINSAVAKVSQPWLIIFIKGIGANWCVCLAIWLALCSRSFSGKVLGAWIPVMTFATLGYEHCIANMFYLSIGLFEGADITVGDCLWMNLVPSTLGNIIGGALFVGTLHTWLHGK